MITVFRHRELLRELIARDIAARYKTSRLGYLWSILQPLLMIAVYATALTHLLGVRWSGSSDPYEFTFMLFCALIVFNFFSESISRSTTIIPSYANYITKLVFPSVLLPWMSIGVGVIHAFIASLVWLLVYMLLVGAPKLTILCAPFVFLSAVPAIAAVSLICACVGVFFRDLIYIVNFVVQSMLFLSPIFFRVEMVPVEYRWIILINPLTSVIEQLRDVMYFGRWPNWSELGAYVVLGLVAYAIANAIYNALSGSFSEAL